jgi:hypothetical protein
MAVKAAVLRVTAEEAVHTRHQRLTRAATRMHREVVMGETDPRSAVIDTITVATVHTSSTTSTTRHNMLMLQMRLVLILTRRVIRPTIGTRGITIARHTILRTSWASSTRSARRIDEPGRFHFVHNTTHDTQQFPFPQSPHPAFLHHESPTA